MLVCRIFELKGIRMNKYIYVVIATCWIAHGYASTDIEMGLGSMTQHQAACAKSGVLDLQSKNIITMPDVTFSGVHTLNLSHNGIVGFDLQELLKAMPYMRTLNVAANKIQELKICMLKGMPHGFSLNVSDNPICSIEPGVERIIDTLRDKDIVIRCYQVLLEERQLKRLQSLLARSSTMHRVQQAVAAGLGVLSMIGGIALLANSEYSCQLSESDSFLSSGATSSVSAVCKYNGIFAAGMCSMLVGVSLLFGRPIMSIIQHDLRESKLYW